MHALASAGVKPRFFGDKVVNTHDLIGLIRAVRSDSRMNPANLKKIFLHNKIPAVCRGFLPGSRVRGGVIVTAGLATAGVGLCSLRLRSGSVGSVVWAPFDRRSLSEAERLALSEAEGITGRATWQQSGGGC